MNWKELIGRDSKEKSPDGQKPLSGPAQKSSANTDLSAQLTKEIAWFRRLASEPSVWNKVQDARNAKDGALRQKQMAYLATLHPFLREKILLELEWEIPGKPVFDRQDLLAAWEYLCYLKDIHGLFPSRPPNQGWIEKGQKLFGKLTQPQRQLISQYGTHADQLVRQKDDIRYQLHQMDKDFCSQLENRLSQEAAQAWKEYHAHIDTLPPNLQKRMAYESAKIRGTRGTSGSHFGGPGASGVIGFCGWASYYEKDPWGREPQYMEGVAFRIDRECFPEGPVRLYFSPWGESEKNALQLVRQYSSGISNVHEEQFSEQDQWGHTHKSSILVFDLDALAIHHTVVLSKQHVLTEELGGYVFVLPRCGEFDCELGEIRDGKRIPLHEDDFCMK